MAALREVPFAQYYGSVDSTPLFVLLAGLYVERTGDEETLAELWPAIEAALQWIDGPGDPDGDGFVEYRRATEQGLANQGWKDSFDAIFHADGKLAEGYIALAEVQGYVFAAKRLAARCARRLGLDRHGAASWKPRRSVLPNASRRRSGARNSAPTRWRSMAPSSRARCGPPMPGSCCSPASSQPDRARLVAADLMSRSSSPAGASAPLRAARRATIRCPITTARSGRTTTR